MQGSGSYAPLPDVATTTLSWNMTLPLGYVGRRIRLQIFWSQSGAVTGNFRLSVYLGLWKVPGPDLFTAPATLTGRSSRRSTLRQPAWQTIRRSTIEAPVTPTSCWTMSMWRRCEFNGPATADDTCADVLQISGVLVYSEVLVLMNRIDQQVESLPGCNGSEALAKMVGEWVAQLARSSEGCLLGDGVGRLRQRVPGRHCAEEAGAMVLLRQRPARTEDLGRSAVRRRGRVRTPGERKVAASVGLGAVTPYDGDGWKMVAAVSLRF